MLCSGRQWHVCVESEPGIFGPKLEAISRSAESGAPMLVSHHPNRHGTLGQPLPPNPHK